MQSREISLRYAKALLELSSENADGILDGLLNLRKITDLKESQKILCNPCLPEELKFELILGFLETQEMKEDVAKLLSSFLNTLVKARRLPQLHSIVEQYQELVEITKSRKTLKLVIPVSLNQEIFSELKDFFYQKWKIHISIELEVDPKILGGFVLHMGHTVCDLSYKRALDDFLDIVAN